MKILTWNIQATRGCDHRYDILRIAEQIQSFGDLDVICLQEVARNIPDLNDDDQLALIKDRFSGYEVIWGPGFSAYAGAEHRSEFGNLTLVKPPLFTNSRVHILPGPPTQSLQMPRTMVEVIVHTGSGQFSVFNTHLAYHSEIEQVAQMTALTTLRDQVITKSGMAEKANSFGPFNYADSCDGVILCGDLNIDLDSDVFTQHVSGSGWLDCWGFQQQIPENRQPTCGCHDLDQWPQGPHVRDYFLATANIAKNTVTVTVDVDTRASDHQPVFLEITS